MINEKKASQETRIMRLEIPRSFLTNIGLENLFKDIKRVEILNAFQYDQKNFFSLQSIEFEEGILENQKDLASFIRKKMNASFFYKIDAGRNTIICILKQKREEGFWPVLFNIDPWAIIFPVIVDSASIIITIMARSDVLHKLKNLLLKYVSDYDVLGQSGKVSLSDLDSNMGLFTIPYPNFTERQKQICSYAARNGYFCSPKKISAKKIAEHFGISISAVNENLKKAENIAMKYFFG
ncbi:MAG: helix-turn-helix domain-containing protein [Promethearchaeota archaeon]